MPLDEFFRKFGRLISLLDMVELMKDFDLKLVYDLAIILGVSAQHRIALEKFALDELKAPDNLPTLDYDKIENMAASLGCPVTAAYVRRAKSTAVDVITYMASPEHDWPKSFTVETPDDLDRVEEFEKKVAQWDEKSRNLINEAAEYKKHLQVIFSDEIQNIKFFCMEQPLIQFWTNPTSGWENVIAVLDSSANRHAPTGSTTEQQIIEASKCLAMGRSV